MRSHSTEGGKTEDKSLDAAPNEVVSSAPRLHHPSFGPMGFTGQGVPPPLMWPNHGIFDMPLFGFPSLIDPVHMPNYLLNAPVIYPPEAFLSHGVHGPRGLGPLANMLSAMQGHYVNPMAFNVMNSSLPVQDTALPVVEAVATNSGNHAFGLGGAILQDSTTEKSKDKSDSSPTDTTTSQIKVETSAVDKERPFKCSYPGCNYSAAAIGNLNRHSRAHLIDRPYKCTFDDCSHAAATQGHLDRHMKAHFVVKRKWRPPEGGRSKGGEQDLGGEQKKRPFKCTYTDCYFTATTQAVVNTHIRTHTGERPYKCDHKDCLYSATTQGNLNRHYRIHTGERPFVCGHEWCNYSATQQGALNAHMKTHQKSKGKTEKEDDSVDDSST
jgi:uncharacterized Zn-finger protein